MRVDDVAHAEEKRRSEEETPMSQSRRKLRYWSELTASEKRIVIISSLLQMSLLVAALNDILRRPPSQINGKKWVWLLVSFINFFGPISYFLFGRKS
jgi:hypothetical protein